MAPPRKDIDLIELEKLCQLQCTDEEIAAWFSVSTRTLERRRRDDEDFAEIMLRGRAKGRISVRRAQMRLVEQGNPSLCIWMGKQLLAQVDRVTATVQEPNRLQNMSIDEIYEEIEELARDCPEFTPQLNAVRAEYEELKSWRARKALPAPARVPGSNDDG